MALAEEHHDVLAGEGAADLPAGIRAAAGPRLEAGGHCLLLRVRPLLPRHHRRGVHQVHVLRLGVPDRFGTNSPQKSFRRRRCESPSLWRRQDMEDMEEAGHGERQDMEEEFSFLILDATQGFLFLIRHYLMVLAPLDDERGLKYD